MYLPVKDIVITFYVFERTIEYKINNGGIPIK